MIAAVTGELGRSDLNIDDMHLGRSASGAAALMVLATAERVPDEVQAAIRALPGVVSVAAL
jgi:L-serine deaminase